VKQKKQKSEIAPNCYLSTDLGARVVVEEARDELRAVLGVLVISGVDTADLRHCTQHITTRHQLVTDADDKLFNLILYTVVNIMCYAVGAYTS